MTGHVRLSKRVSELARCSRSDAEQYIEGGWVSVDGRVVEAPQHLVGEARIEIDPAARLAATEPATLLLHAPAVAATAGAAAMPAPRPDTRWEGDASDLRVLERHFARLVTLMPLDREASGLVVVSQDPRVQRRLDEDRDSLEQEFVVEVAGEIAPYGLARLNHGLVSAGRRLAPCRVSWQNEVRLRFAIKAVRDGQLRDMCAQVGLDVVAIRRLRIGRVPLAKMPAGTWRYLPPGERF